MRVDRRWLAAAFALLALAALVPVGLDVVPYEDPCRPEPGACGAKLQERALREAAYNFQEMATIVGVLCLAAVCRPSEPRAFSLARRGAPLMLGTAVALFTLSGYLLRASDRWVALPADRGLLLVSDPFFGDLASFASTASLFLLVLGALLLAATVVPVRRRAEPQPQP